MSEEEQRRLEAEVLAEPRSLDAWVALSRFLARGGAELQTVRVEDHLDRLEEIFAEQPADRSLWDLIRPAWDREMVWLCETPAPQTNWKVPRSRRLKQFLARLPDSYQLEFLFPYLEGPPERDAAIDPASPEALAAYREREAIYVRQANALDLVRRVVRGRRSMFQVLCRGLSQMDFPRELFNVVLASAGERRFMAMIRDVYLQDPSLLAGRWLERAVRRLPLSPENHRVLEETCAEARSLEAARHEEAGGNEAE